MLVSLGSVKCKPPKCPRHGHVLLGEHPGCSRDQQLQLVQNDCVMIFPVSQHVCMATAASVQFLATKQQPEEERLNMRGTFIITVQMEKTYQVTGCPSFLLK